MADVYAISSGNFDDGYLNNINTSADGVAARNATTATGNNFTSTSILCLHSKLVFLTNNWRGVYRPVLSFDMSGESGTVESVNLKLRSNANTSGISKFTWTKKTHVCKIDPDGSTWANDDYDSADGWVSSDTYEGEVTEYATAFTNAASTSHTIALNATAISDLNSVVGSGKFHIMLMHENDFKEDDTLLNTPSTTGGGVTNGDGGSFASMEDSTVSYRPHLNITYSAVVPPTPPNIQIKSGYINLKSGKLIIK